MIDLLPYHGAIVFIHVLSVFGFLLAHGVSAGVLFRLRGETEPAAVRSLIGMSAQAVNWAGVGLLFVLGSGILAGLSGNYWLGGPLWLWVSLGVFIVVGGLMTPLARFYLDRVRAAVGIDTKTGKLEPAFQFDPQALQAAVASGQPMLIAALGVGGVAVLAWLMMFKPF